MASSQSTNKETSLLPRYAQHVLINIERMREEESLHDVVFIVEKERFPANRCIIASASPILRNLLTNGMKETYQREIPLEEVDSDVWRVVLDYLYTGRLDFVNLKHALRYLEFADRFQMSDLEKAISSYIEQNLDASNCCEVLATVDRIDSVALREKAVNTLENNFYDVYRTSRFIKLPYELVLGVIEHCTLVVRSELDVFLAVVHWVLCSGVRGKDSKSNAEVMKLASELMKRCDLGFEGMEGDIESGTNDKGNYGELFELVDLSNLSNADLRRAARFCLDLCNKTRITLNIDLKHMREFGEKAVEKLLTLYNPIPDEPVPPCCRVPHGQYDTFFTYRKQFNNIRNLSYETSPIFVDKSQKLKWFFEVYFNGYKQAENKFLSCYLYRKLENSSKRKQGEDEEDEDEGKMEVVSQIYVEVENDNGRSAPLIFEGTVEKDTTMYYCYGSKGWGKPNLVPLSALVGKDTITVGIILYFKSK